MGLVGQFVAPLRRPEGLSLLGLPKSARQKSVLPRGAVRLILQRPTDRSDTEETALAHIRAVHADLAEAQIKAQMREQVRTALLHRSAPRTSSYPRFEVLTTMRWGMYGAALAWSQHLGRQTAEVFVEETLLLTAAGMVAFENGTPVS